MLFKQKKLLQLVILAVVLFSTFINGYAQISGYIVDKNNDPIQGAHILHIKSLNHYHSDPFGKFTITEIQPGDLIQISHVGFETQKVVFTDSIDLKVVLIENSISLPEIQVSPELDALNIMTDINLLTKPVSSAQEVLTNMPGLFIGQHAGGGKAEQIFLRGFDLDHGTDINISVDGMPVNLVSHAHGQGYADLHFLIPETIDAVNIGKGPYYADRGNLATAGFVSFNTRKKLEENTIKFETGRFNHQRLLGMFSLVNSENHHAYIASDLTLADGPFESPQDLSRFNIIGRYNLKTRQNDDLSVLMSHFSSKWDASGQIPVRAVEQGLISRFGAIDDTEGGETSRSNIGINYLRNLDNNTFLTSNAYFAHYDFLLFSNFTFFLNDPINGDQIMQKEERNLAGGETTLNKYFGSTIGDWSFQVGAGFRYDMSKDNELSHTYGRSTTLSRFRFGDITESNIYSFVNLNYEIGKWTINPGVRFDQFSFIYHDGLIGQYNKLSAEKGIISPKMNILYNPSTKLQVYLKSGKGFHSNDTRVSVVESGKKILPAAYGTDIGVIWKPTPYVFLNAAWWYLKLEQEFVYVGDEGIVEPSGKSKRSGLDLGIRYQLTRNIFWEADLNYAKPRSILVEQKNEFIPLAPSFTLTSGLQWNSSSYSGGIHLRHMGNRPADETYSITAEGYTLLDVNCSYQFQYLRTGFSIQNVLNTEWIETQFATTSRLSDESEPVEEIHFTPGTPLNLKVFVEFSF